VESAAPDHTVPYGTVLSMDAFPGTSCLATIRMSLRDKGHSPIEGPRINLALIGEQLAKVVLAGLRVFMHRKARQVQCLRGHNGDRLKKTSIMRLTT
jgi:hypothetical protein